MTRRAAHAPLRQRDACDAHAARGARRLHGNFVDIVETSMKYDVFARPGAVYLALAACRMAFRGRHRHRVVRFRSVVSVRQKFSQEIGVKARAGALTRSKLSESVPGDSLRRCLWNPKLVSADARGRRRARRIFVCDARQMPSFFFSSSFTACGLALPPDAFIT